MTKVITYGTYDLLHHGHIKLLERAKTLGDYLIVGVTADDFDKTRGKINVEQSLMERIEAVRSTGIADEIIIEEYEGQKIDDIRRYGVDIFTVGSDWEGKFDYLNEYCKVVYLPRTEGVSSSDIRSVKCKTRLGVVGEPYNLVKFIRESKYVNGIELTGVCALDLENARESFSDISIITDDYEKLIYEVDAVYIVSHPSKHYQQIKRALELGVHVLCESPISLRKSECDELIEYAAEHKCILMEGIKTAYSTAYSRLLLLVKSGRIGDVVSVDATCTSIRNIDVKNVNAFENTWNTITEWGPPALLPIFQILGTHYESANMSSITLAEDRKFDVFTKISFTYESAVASLKIGKQVKSEGELIISGTKGYVYVPAPWWKTDYFEIRYENPAENRRYFYQLDGEGIRYEIVAFSKAIETGKNISYISSEISTSIASVMEIFHDGHNVKYLN